MFLATKLADPNRPVLDASGYAHRVRETDVCDSHDYEQDPVKFGEKMAGLSRDGNPFISRGWDGRRTNARWNGKEYHQQPYFVSEFGGIWWSPTAASDKSWGYGDRVKSPDEFYTRFEGLCKVLLDDPVMFGYCYTQLTDIFPEENGIYMADRRAKFDLGRIRGVQIRKAGIEIAAEKKKQAAKL
jgi:beta-glucuronidase